MSETAALWALFTSAFTSATILPGSSEIALAIFQKNYANATMVAFFVATLANTLGSLTSYALGRFIPAAQIEAKISKQQLDRARRYGAWSLLFAWVPVVGDALCVAAGALRLNSLKSALALLIGKGARYAVLLGALRAFGF